MDALVAGLPLFYWRQVSFMVRQDVFKNKVAAFFLKHMLLFPAYRMRDGIDSLKKNKETFAHTTRLMKWKKGVIIFPEANHAVPRKLRPMKKGLGRAAFGAMDELPPEEDILIIPTGINYLKPQEISAGWYLKYGEPISVRAYYDLYKENPAVALNTLRDVVAEAMRALVIDIRNTECYDEIEALIRMGTNRYAGHRGPIQEQFIVQKKVVAKVETKLEAEGNETFKTKSKDYTAVLKKLDFKDWLLDYEKGIPMTKLLWHWCKLVLLLPCFLIGGPIFAWPLRFPVEFANKNIKDPGFRSSISFVMSVGLFSIPPLIFFVVGLFVLPHWWLAFLAFPGSWLLSVATMAWHRSWNRLRAMRRYNAGLRRKDPDLIKALEIRKGMLEWLGPID